MDSDDTPHTPSEYHFLSKGVITHHLDKVKLVFNAKESCRAKQHFSWMNGTHDIYFMSETLEDL